MKCLQCSYLNRQGVTFCESCGARLNPSCPTCGSGPPLNGFVCDVCGSDVGERKDSLPIYYGRPLSYTPASLADKILSSRGFIEGARKMVTALVADVADYTSICERLDPEEVHSIMTGCFRVLADEVHRYEGTVNQFMGDGVMAIFGVPLSHEDHAQRACTAALRIQESMEAYGTRVTENHGIVFRVRMGLHSGPLVVGSIGEDLRMDYTALGDTMNLAFAVERQAEPGTVLASERTHRLSRDFFHFTSKGYITVDGKAAPSEVFQLQRSRYAHRPRLGLERPIQAPMVGRKDELALLEDRLRKATTGAGSIINIVGEAGMGKSRLVAELVNTKTIQGVAHLQGTALSTGRHLNFHPIISLIKDWARVNEEDSETDVHRKLFSAIAAVTPEEVTEIFPFVSTLMGLNLTGREAERLRGMTGEALQKLILKSIRDLLTRVTQDTPILVVMEDLHWADITSISLLETVFRIAETQPVVFINLLRPGYPDTGDSLLSTTMEKYPDLCFLIRLDALDEQMSETLIQEILPPPALPPLLRRKIVERSGGNPYFIEEVVQSFIDEGTILSENDTHSFTKRIEFQTIPQTINDVLMARIDSLDEATRDILKLASVIGRNFFRSILVEIVRSNEDTDHRLACLKDLQLITERRKAGELEYSFKHDLVQEVAYESIRLQQRRTLHLKVAEAIERVFEHRLYEYYGLLASHYSKGGNEKKTEEFLTKAGDAATRSSASSEALYYFQEALSLYLKKKGGAASTERLAILEENISISLFDKGLYTEAIEHFDKALAFYGEGPLQDRISIVREYVTGFLILLLCLYAPSLRFKRTPSQRDKDRCSLLVKRTEALAQIAPNRFVLEAFRMAKVFSQFDLNKLENGVATFVTMSGIFYWSGLSYRLSRRILDLFRNRIDKEDVKAMMAYRLSRQGHAYYSGEWNVEDEYDEHLIHQSLRQGEIFPVAAYFAVRGQMEADRGHFENSHAMADRLSDIAETYEHEMSLVWRGSVLARLLRSSGRLEDALESAKEIMTLTAKGAVRMYFSGAWACKARIDIMLGNVDEAENSLMQAKAELPGIEAAPPGFHMNLLLAEFMIALHRFRDSLGVGGKLLPCREGRRALVIGRKTVRTSRKAALDRTESFRLMGTCYWLLGKQRNALKWWGKSLREGHRLGARPEVARTYVEAGKHISGSDKGHTTLQGMAGEALLHKSKDMFEEMNMRWDLHELERTCSVYFESPEKGLP